MICFSVCVRNTQACTFRNGQTIKRKKDLNGSRDVSVTVILAKLDGGYYAQIRLQHEKPNELKEMKHLAHSNTPTFMRSAAN